jgi:hypothetical protein
MNLLEELIFMRDFVILFLNHLLQSRILLIVIKQKREREEKKRIFSSHSLTSLTIYLSEKKIVLS